MFQIFIRPGHTLKIVDVPAIIAPFTLPTVHEPYLGQQLAVKRAPGVIEKIAKELELPEIPYIGHITILHLQLRLYDIDQFACIFFDTMPCCTSAEEQAHRDDHQKNFSHIYPFLILLYCLNYSYFFYYS
jgi:hypothetical protein